MGELEVFQNFPDHFDPQQGDVNGDKTGFASPAQDHFKKTINILKDLSLTGHTIFFIKVKGDLLNEANLRNGDVVVVDTAKKKKMFNGCIVWVQINGVNNIRIIEKIEGRFFLKGRSSKCNVSTIEIRRNDDFVIKGVVVFIFFNSFRNNLEYY